MTSKEAHDILAACGDRSELRAALHDHFGFSVDAARARVREWFDEMQVKNEELTRASVARAFRDAREKEAARLQFIQDQDHVRAQVLEAARQIPVPPRVVTYCDGTVRSEKRKDTAEDREYWWKSTVQPRVVAEIAERLNACKDRDQLEAELVRSNWPEDAIAEYMEQYGTQK